MERPPEPVLDASSTETTGIRVPPPLYYVAGLLVGVGLEAAFPIDRPPAAVTIVAIVIGAAGWLAFDGVATMAFIRARTSMIPMKPSSALVTTGVYRFTRNPMYVGMAFAYGVIAFAVGLIWPLVFLPLVVLAVDRFVIAKEEPYLERRFGQSYRDYMARTGRWF